MLAVFRKKNLKKNYFNEHLKSTLGVKLKKYFKIYSLVENILCYKIFLSIFYYFI